MEIELKEFFEKIEKNILDEKIRTQDLNLKIDEDKYNFSDDEKDIKEKLVCFEKEVEIIKKQDFEEDLKEEDLVLNNILEDLDKNIFINIREDAEEKNKMACKEILEILRYPKSHKNLRGVVSPFKPLYQPRKISMVGKVFYNSAYNNENDENKTSENTNNTANNDGK